MPANGTEVMRPLQHEHALSLRGPTNVQSVTLPSHDVQDPRRIDKCISFLANNQNVFLYARVGPTPVRPLIRAQTFAGLSALRGLNGQICTWTDSKWTTSTTQWPLSVAILSRRPRRTCKPSASSPALTRLDNGDAFVALGDECEEDPTPSAIERGV